MKELDRREEFKNVPWQQGRLLETQETKRWSLYARQIGSTMERKIAFAYFSAEDGGRGRVYLYCFQSAKECLDAVEQHNVSLK